MTSWRRVGPVAAAMLLSLAAVLMQRWALDHYGLSLSLPEWLWVKLATGWAFLIAGLLARRRRPESGMGALLVVFALVWIGSLILVAPLIGWYEVGESVAIYGLLFVVLLSFPSGHLRGWERWMAAAWMIFISGVSVAIVMFDDPYARIDDPSCCPGHLLLIEDNAAMRDAIREPAVIVGLVVFLALVLFLFSKWRRASAVGRRRSTLGSVALPVMILLVAIPLLNSVFGSFFLSPRQELYLQNLSLLILPIVILTSLLRTRLVHARVADMMLDLDSTPTPEQLEQGLRSTFGSPDLELLFWSEDVEGYVDVAGQPVDVAAREGTLTDLGERTAILHDPELDQELVMAAGSAARLAINNARLQAELRSQLVVAVESRRRLVDATDEARRRVERDLHDGAQQRLVTLSATLKKAMAASGQDSDEVQELLAAAADEADVAIAELRELAQGVHPAILTQAGLEPAIASLTDRAPIPVIADVATERFPDEVEATVYFVVAEGLANAFKHSDADEVRVGIRPADGSLVVTIEDDGTGGIDPEGSGLRGLKDRVGAMGGRLRVDRGAGRGARLTAWVPIRESGEVS